MKEKRAVGILAVLCFLIISVWFKDGKLLAHGEEGLILANPSRSIQLYKYSWNEIGPGMSAPGLNPMVPLLYLELQISKIGIQNWQFQAIIFYFLMVTGSVSVLFLTKKLFQSNSKTARFQYAPVIAALFYILNPVSLLGVWTRFLLSFMFFYSLVPLFFYLFVMGLESKKIFFIFLTPLIALAFSFAFSAPSLPLLLWFLPALYSIFSLKEEDSGYKFYPLVYLILSFCFWFLINLWWIYPYKLLSEIAYAVETSPEHAIGTLKANSAYYSLPNVLRLIHSGLLYTNELFGSVYKTPFFIFLSWIVPIVVIYGLYKYPRGKHKRFFLLSFFTLIFLVKGTSWPFGNVFLWFFSHVSFLQVYRNPFEKIGILLPVIYAPLFGFGIFLLASKIQNIWKRGLLLTFFIVCLLITNWPFFTGAIVFFDNKDLRTEVPVSFERANNSIRGKDHIIFSVPQMGGSTGSYNWKNKYLGVESSEYLFNYPVIAKTYDPKSFSGQILVALSNNKLDENLTGVAQLFSANIIALRKDTNFSTFGYNLDAYDKASKTIAKEEGLNKIFDSQEVSLWELPEDKIVRVIYTPESIKTGNSAEDLVLLLKKHQFDPKKEVFICQDKDNCNPSPGVNRPKEITVQKVPEKTEIKKISPVNYKIEIKNSTGTFILVFNNSYHPGWSIKIRDEILPADKHFVANGYANGFIVDEKGSYDLSLVFLPEEKIKKFTDISIWSAEIGVLIICIFFVKKIIKSGKMI